MWVVYLFVASLLSTILPLPPVLSPADPMFIGLVFSKSIILIPLMVGFDTFNAYIAYLFTDKIMVWVKKLEVFNYYALIPFTIHPKAFELGFSILYKEVDLKPYMDKYGKWFIMVASASPLPFTLSIYAVGASGYNNDLEFTISVMIGRIVKYTAIYFAFRLGISLF